MYKKAFKTYLALSTFLYFFLPGVTFSQTTTLIVDPLPEGLTTAVFSLPNLNVIEVPAKGGEYALKPFTISTEEEAKIIPIDCIVDCEKNPETSKYKQKPTDIFYYALINEKQPVKDGIRSLLHGNKQSVNRNTLHLTVKKQQSEGKYILVIADHQH